MKTTDITALEVLLHGLPIGTITRLPSDRFLFYFDETYLDNSLRPTLSLAFKGQFNELITDIRPTRTRLHPFFSNLLPEGPLLDYLASRAGVNPNREFFLLAVLGQDLPGAVTVRPATSDYSQHGSYLVQEPTNRPEPMRFSLAGVQLKFSALTMATGGLTIPVKGSGGSWIVKLPPTHFPHIPENEYSMMQLAKMIGIDVPETRLVSMDSIEGLPEDIQKIEGNALAVRRFDRSDNGTLIHIEDFAQIFNVYPEAKYKNASYRNIAEVIWTESGEEGIIEFVRRLVFNALIGNADMHLKNWSLIYPNKRDAALAPGYDFVSTIAYLEDDSTALKLVKSKKFSDVSSDQFSYLAAKAGLPGEVVLQTVRDTVDGFLTHWASEKKHFPLPSSHVDIIDQHYRTLPIAR